MILKNIKKIINNESQTLFQRLDNCYKTIVLNGATDVMIYCYLGFVIISCKFNQKWFNCSIFL